MRTFTDAVVAITGAGSGIGRALAVAASAKGARLALCDLNAEGLAATIDLLPRSSGVTNAVVDVADVNQVRAFAADVRREHGRVNAIINNAGVSYTGPITEVDYADLHWLININFWGVVHGTKEFLPHLIDSGDGHIVNLSSLFGLVAVPGQSGYNAAKFAVRGFTESVRQDLLVAGAPVQVTCVHPGGIKTGIARHGRATAGEDHEANSRLFDDHLARLEPSVAADQILRAMLRNQPRLLIGADARALHRLATVLGPRYQRLFAARAKSMQNRR